MGDRAFAVSQRLLPEPDECRFEGVPSNRGDSSGATSSTSIASGGGARKVSGLTESSATIRTPKWKTTETTAPGRI
jgi:hypothetical protein